MEYAQLESLNRVMEDEKKRKPSHMQEKDPRKRLPDPPFHGRLNEWIIHLFRWLIQWDTGVSFILGWRFLHEYAVDDSETHPVFYLEDAKSIRGIVAHSVIWLNNERTQGFLRYYDWRKE